MTTEELPQPNVHYDFTVAGIAPDTQVILRQPNRGNHTMALRPTLLRVTCEGSDVSARVRGHYVNSDGRVSRLFYEATYKQVETPNASSLESLPEWALPYLESVRKSQ